MLFSPSQLWMHGTWQVVSIMHPFICKWHCIALCGSYLVSVFSFFLLILSPLYNLNTWNMTGSEYNASIHLQVTMHCIVWLLFSCRFLLPLLMFFSSSQLGMHGTWQVVSVMHPFICKWHCIALCGCYSVTVFSFLPVMLFSPSQLGIHGTWQGVSIIHPFICKWHCVAFWACYLVAVFSFLFLMLISSSQLGMHGT